MIVWEIFGGGIYGYVERFVFVYDVVLCEERIIVCKRFENLVCIILLFMFIIFLIFMNVLVCFVFKFYVYYVLVGFFEMFYY